MQADPGSSVPFQIEEFPGNRCLLRFNEVVESLRPHHRLRLEELLGERNAILVDLSRTNVLTSGWLRFLCILTVTAGQSGKVLAITGIGTNIATCAEGIGVMDCLKFLTLDEWKQV